MFIEYIQKYSLNTCKSYAHIFKKKFTWIAYDQTAIMSKCTVSTTSQNATGLALLGHCYYLLGDLDRARNCYESVVRCAQLSPMLHVVLLRLADIYMKEKKVSCLMLGCTTSDRVD